MSTQLTLFNTTGNMPSNQKDIPPSTSCQDKFSFSTKNQKRQFTVFLYPHCLEYKTTHSAVGNRKYKNSKRGNISSFTNRSRFRLLQVMSKVRTNLPRQPIFFTLTYHHGHNYEKLIHQKHLHLFLTKLRAYDPQLQYIWRLEYQKRGAPHFHFIIFPGRVFDFDHYRKYTIICSRIWHKIADPNSRVHQRFGFKAKQITSYKMACAYISKYVGKVDELHQETTSGKQYGHSRNLPLQKPLIMNLTEEEAFNLISRLKCFLSKKVGKFYENNPFFTHELDQFVFIDAYQAESMLPFQHRDKRLRLSENVHSLFSLDSPVHSVSNKLDQ